LARSNASNPIIRNRPALRRIALPALAGIGGLFAAPVAAQVTAPPVPQPPTREEVEPPAPPQPLPSPRLSVEGDIERSPCPLADPAYANIPITLSAVTFNNLGPVDPAELASSYAPYLGTQQPISVLCDIRDAAATVLRRKGYLAAVQVPTQQIDGGAVRLEVLYARVTAIRVRGDAGRGERMVARYLERLTEDAVFNQRTAERYLLLARDLPGYDVRLTLVPAGAGPGELIGDVTVRRTPYAVDLNLQNLAARDAGPFGAQLRGQLFGLTGLGDRTYVSAYSTLDFSEQQIVQVGHEMRLGAEGLTLSGRFTYAWTEPPIGGFGVTHLNATTLIASGEARYPVIRRQAVSLWAAAGFDYVNQDIDFIGPLSRDRLRVGYAELSGEAIDLGHGAKPRWRTTGSVSLRQGLDIFGASAPCRVTCGLVRVPTSRADGDPTSTAIRAEFSFEASLSNTISVFMRTRGQLAFDPLLSFEEYSGGNYTIGRGYDPGSIVGDDGIGYQAELRGPRLSPFQKIDVQVQPFVFADLAWAWDDARFGREDPQWLASVGAGLRGRLGDRFQLDLSFAVPTRRAGFLTETPDPRLLFSLTTLLLPWGDR